MEWVRHSKYDKCLRILEWVLCYKTNLKAKTKGLTINIDQNIRVGEMKAAEQEIIKLVQR